MEVLIILALLTTMLLIMCFVRMLSLFLENEMVREKNGKDGKLEVQQLVYSLECVA